MRSLLTVANLLGRGGSPAERARARLMAAGAALATWFLFGGAEVLSLHGELDQRLGPIADPGTRGGTAFSFGLMVLPVAAFLHQSGRLATADRERRLAALRLAGATPREVRLLGAIETTRSAALGTVVGAVAFVILQFAGRRLLLSPGSKANVGLPPLLCAAAMVLVVVVAAVSGLLAGRHVIATPLGVTRRAAHRRPGLTGPIVFAGCLVLAVTSWLANWVFHQLPEAFGVPAFLAGVVAAVAGPLLYSSRLVWFTARVTARRANSAETLIAARSLESDPRPWGRTISVVALAVAIGSGAGWIEAGIMTDRGRLEPFWLTSFALVDLALLVGMVVAAAALLVHQAEYLLEHGPVLAALHATGVSEADLRRVLLRQALIASVLPCFLAALPGLIALAGPRPLMGGTAWLLWPFVRALIMVGLGVLAAVTAARTSRRRLRRALGPSRLRTE
jgi:hypothetical protein